MRDQECPCKRKDCERHGDCAACRARHAKTKRRPYCEARKGGKREIKQNLRAQEGQDKP